MIAETFFAVAVLASQGMGEQTPALGASVGVSLPYVEQRAVFDTSDKQRGGFALRSTTQARLGLFVGGLDFTYRNGGDWSKRVAWLRAGVKVRGAELVIRRQVWTDRPAANNQVTSVLGRFELTGKRALIAVEPGAHRFTQSGQRLTGWSLDVFAGLRLGR